MEDRTASWQFIGSLILVAAILLLFAAFVGMTESCKSGFANSEILAEEPEAASCFEFWLNRYQALLAGILAVGAAGATLHFTQRQLREARTLSGLEMMRYLREEEAQLQRLIKALRTNNSSETFLRTVRNGGFPGGKGLQSAFVTFVEALRDLTRDPGSTIWTQELEGWITDRELESVPIMEAVKTAWERIPPSGGGFVMPRDIEEELYDLEDKLKAIWVGTPAKLLEVANHMENELSALKASRRTLTDQLR